MRKKVLKVLGIVFVALAACAILFVITAALVFLPLYSEELIEEYPSADGQHTVYVYVGDAGVMSSWSIVCDVKGDHIWGKRRIYVKNDTNIATVRWIDDRTVWINVVALDIYEDRYPDPG